MTYDNRPINSVYFKNKLGERKTRTPLNTAKFNFRRFSPKVKPILVVSVAIILLVTLFNFLLRSKFMTVTQVEINSLNGFYLVNLNDIRKLSEDNLLGKNILSVDVYETNEILKRNFLGIKDIKITKSYSGKVQITISERTPIGIISQNTEYYLVDTEGFIIGSVSEDYINKTESLKILPKISYNSEIKIGSFIDKNIIPAYIELYQNIEKNNIKASSVTFNSYFLELNMEGGVKLLIGTDKSITKSLEYVLNLIRQLKVEGKNIKKIDLRYDKVIVEY